MQEDFSVFEKNIFTMGPITGNGQKRACLEWKEFALNFFSHPELDFSVGSWKSMFI